MYDPTFDIDFDIPDEILSQVPLEKDDKINEEKEQENPQNQRFVSLSERDLDKIVDDSEAKATKKSTKWGVKIFEGKQTRFCKTYTLLKDYNTVFLHIFVT